VKGLSDRAGGRQAEEVARPSLEEALSDGAKLEELLLTIPYDIIGGRLDTSRNRNGTGKLVELFKEAQRAGSEKSSEFKNRVWRLNRDLEPHILKLKDEYLRTRDQLMRRLVSNVPKEAQERYERTATLLGVARAYLQHYERETKPSITQQPVDKLLG
jgi:hypothetical protein